MMEEADHGGDPLRFLFNGRAHLLLMFRRDHILAREGGEEAPSKLYNSVSDFHKRLPRFFRGKCGTWSPADVHHGCKRSTIVLTMVPSSRFTGRE